MQTAPTCMCVYYSRVPYFPFASWSHKKCKDLALACEVRLDLYCTCTHTWAVLVLPYIYYCQLHTGYMYVLSKPPQYGMPGAHNEEQEGKGEGVQNAYALN